MLSAASSPDLSEGSESGDCSNYCYTRKVRASASLLDLHQVGLQAAKNAPQGGRPRSSAERRGIAVAWGR